MSLKNLIISSPHNGDVFALGEQISFTGAAEVQPVRALYYHWYSSLPFPERGEDKWHESLKQPVELAQQPPAWKSTQLEPGAQYITLAASDQQGERIDNWQKVTIGGIAGGERLPPDHVGQCLIHVLQSFVSSVHQLPDTPSEYWLEIEFQLPVNWSPDKRLSGTRQCQPEYNNWRFNLYLRALNDEGPGEELLPYTPGQQITVRRDGKKQFAVFQSTSRLTGLYELILHVSFQGSQHTPVNHIRTLSLLPAASIKEKRNALLN
ncbi:hypothetical protein ACO0K9_03440 [Undibacterium sp. Ji50W]|uniref:hypothetical protein n=1 Tax=Undibacterium sp. Ji50W TaxID=3413041 RepID=UPI003BF23052